MTEELKIWCETSEKLGISRYQTTFWAMTPYSLVDSTTYCREPSIYYLPNYTASYCKRQHSWHCSARTSNLTMQGTLTFPVNCNMVLWQIQWNTAVLRSSDCAWSYGRHNSHKHSFQSIPPLTQSWMMLDPKPVLSRWDIIHVAVPHH